MENVISEIHHAGLNLRLTSEKIFIKTSASSETFALRSINGIGVVDLVEKYNSELSKYNKTITMQIFRIIIGVILIVIGSFIKFGLWVFFTTPGILILLIGLIFLGKASKPTLLSSVRIMMTGGSRDFEFDKASYGSGKIAEFVASVESTLSAYHQK